MTKAIVDSVNDLGYNLCMDTCDCLDDLPEFGHEGAETHLLMQIMRTSHALMQALPEAVGVQVARLAVLRVLVSHRGLGIGTREIARRLGIDAAAVTRQVQAMEEEGLVTREPHERDGRRVAVKLTDAGRRVFEQVHRRCHEFERMLGEAVGTQDAEMAARVLARVRAAVVNRREEAQL